MAEDPRVHIALGRMIFICLYNSRLVQVLLSFGEGFLFFGGLHFTILVMYISSLFAPRLSITRVRSWPDLPTNGRACSSSFCPGPSPKNMSFAFGFPSPNTMLFLPSVPRGHFMQRAHGAYTSSSSFCL